MTFEHRNHVARDHGAIKLLMVGEMECHCRDGLPRPNLVPHSYVMVGSGEHCRLPGREASEPITTATSFLQQYQRPHIGSVAVPELTSPFIE